MRNDILFLSTLVTALSALVPTSFGQGEQIDAVTKINGQSPTTDASKIYFNAENCADASGTDYELTLTNADGVTQDYIWAGREQAGCEENSKRTDLQLLCRPLASSNPAQVGDNATIVNLTLQELIDTEIVDCENMALAGQSYWLYSFRNTDPGGTDVPVTGYGIAPIIVDVTPPEQLSLESGLDQVGTQFGISWNRPADSNEIQLYRLYRSDDDDAANASDTGLTLQGSKSEWIITASSLNLAVGETTFLYVTAVDEAAMVPGDGNEGPLSEATSVTFEDTNGFCDDPNINCSGCSVSPMILANGQPSSGIWLLGALFAIVCGWRLRR